MKLKQLLIVVSALMSPLAFAASLTIHNKMDVPANLVITYKNLASDQRVCFETHIQPNQIYPFSTGPAGTFYSLKWYFNKIRCYINIPSTKFMSDGEIKLFGNRYEINFDGNGILDKPKQYDAQWHNVGDISDIKQC